MPPWVSESWLKEHGCVGENFGDIPIPLVRMPPDYEPAAYELAIYEEIEGEPGRYELEWFSARGRLPGDAFPVLTAPGSARECAAGFGTAGCA